MKFAVRPLAAAVLLLAACSNHVTRDRWQHMTTTDKQIYVDSMIGGERAKSAKGGHGRTYSHPPQTYIGDIDNAYAHGDRRDPAAIFAELADRR